MTAPDLLDIHQFEALVASIHGRPLPDRRPLVIAIGGAGGSGKSTLAGYLSSVLGPVIPLDHFAIDGCEVRSDDWDGSYDHARFAAEVLEPLSRGEPVSYRATTWETGASIGMQVVVPARYVIIEGVSALRTDFRSYYDYMIWMDCAPDLATERGRARSRAAGDYHHDRLWTGLWRQNDDGFYRRHRPDKTAHFMYSVSAEPT